MGWCVFITFYVDGLETEIMKRRQLLSAAPALLAGTTGCAERLSSEHQKTPGKKKLVLAYVKISNHHNESHTVDVLIEKEDSVFSWDNYYVDKFDEGSNAAGIQWVREGHTGIQDRWAIAARLRSKSTGLRVNLIEYPYPNRSCVGIVIRITDRGNLRFIDDVTSCNKWKKPQSL